ERCEQGGDVELGVEAVREHPDESGARLRVERREAIGVDREVDLERRPLMPLPVLVQRAEWSWACHELLDLHRLLVDPHANRNLNNPSDRRGQEHPLRADCPPPAKDGSSRSLPTSAAATPSQKSGSSTTINTRLAAASDAARPSPLRSDPLSPRTLQRTGFRR